MAGIDERYLKNAAPNASGVICIDVAVTVGHPRRIQLSCIFTSPLEFSMFIQECY